MESNYIKVDLEGNLSYKGANMTHEKILEFFKHLDFEQLDDKTYVLKWHVHGVTQKINVQVEDTLFVVKDLIRKDNKVVILLNDDSSEELNVRKIDFDHDVPYIKVKNDRVKARFSRHAAFKLGEHLAK